MIIARPCYVDIQYGSKIYVKKNLRFNYGWTEREVRHNLTAGSLIVGGLWLASFMYIVADEYMSEKGLL